MSGFQAPSRPSGDRPENAPDTPAMSDPRLSESPPRALEVSLPQEKRNIVVCMPFESCLCSLLLGLVITVLFELVALGLDHWTRYNTGTELRQYGLYYCNDCPQAFYHTSWSCLRTQTCSVDGDLGICKNANDMIEASGAYIGLTITSLIFLLLTIERVLYHYCKVDYGANVFLYIFSLVFFLAQGLAVLIWFGISAAEFQNDCETKPISTNRWEICATEGPSVAVVTAFCVTASLIAVWAINRRRTPEVRKPINLDSVKIMGVNYKCCLLVPFVGMVLILAVLIATIATTNWVTMGGVKGSLYTLKTYEQYQDYGYDCIMRHICNIDVTAGACTTFDHMETGSRVFAVLEILCLFFWLLWVEPVIGLFFNRDYGYPPLNVAWGVLLLMLHSAAIGSWFSVTGAKFSETGYDLQAETGYWNIKAEAGPALAVLNSLLILLVLGVYLAVYLARHGPYRPVKSESQ